MVLIKHHINYFLASNMEDISKITSKKVFYYWISEDGLRKSLSTVSFNWEDLGGVNEYISDSAEVESNSEFIIPIINLHGYSFWSLKHIVASPLLLPVVMEIWSLIILFIRFASSQVNELKLALELDDIFDIDHLTTSFWTDWIQPPACNLSVVVKLRDITEANKMFVNLLAKSFIRR